MDIASLSCNVCGLDEADAADVETASVPSNVRAFRNESFRIWRCRSCSTIHARDDVDLEHYYTSYPFHALPVDWRLRVMYRQQL